MPSCEATSLSFGRDIAFNSGLSERIGSFSVIVFISVMALRIAQKERLIYLSEKILHRLMRAG
jgi:hypothetical protein